MLEVLALLIENISGGDLSIFRGGGNRGVKAPIACKKNLRLPKPLDKQGKCVAIYLLERVGQGCGGRA